MSKRVIFLLLILLFLFFLPMFLNRFILDRDLSDKYMPKLFLVGESIRNFSFPSSESGMGLGFPIYKDIQSGIFYPLNWIFALPFDFLRLIQFAIFLNAFIYGLGLFFLINLLYPDKQYNTVLLIIMLFSGFFISHIPNYTMLCTIAISPLFLYFFISFLKERKKNMFLLSIFSGVFLIIAGYPHIFFLVFILSLFLSIKWIRGWNSILNPMMIFIFIFFMSLFVTAPTMNLAGYSFRAGESMKYNIIPLKYLILLIFPNLFGGSSVLGRQNYDGILNINEVQFYSSMLFLFALSYALRRIIVDRDYRYSLKFVIPAAFLFLSFFTEFNFHIFLTPSRALGFSVITFLFAVLPDSLQKYDKYTLIVFSALFFMLFFSLVFRGFFSIDMIIPLLFYISYILFFVFIWRKNKFAYLILSILVFADLYISVGGIINYSEKNNVENESHEELREKYVITYLPNEIVFYSDYMKDYFKTENLEELKKYSTCGNRGIYYKAYSFNLFQNFTFAKYVDFFSDTSIITGGFSNINFIMNPLIYDYDYVFIPDMPAFFNVIGTLLIPYRENIEDTFFAYYTGNLNNITEIEAEGNDYIGNLDSLKSGILIVSGPTMLKGNGKIIMLAKYISKEIVHFPEMFEKMNLNLIDKNPFCLFKKERENNKDIDFITSPIDGSFIKGKKANYIPVDLLGGLFMTLITIITIFQYIKKEFK